MISLGFSALSWQYNAQGIILEKPKVIGGGTVLVSEEGKVFVFNSVGPALRWKKDLQRMPIDLDVDNNQIIVTADTGRITELDATGNIVFEVALSSAQANITRVYGTDVSSRGIAINTNQGVVILEKSGAIRNLIFHHTGTGTEPKYLEDGIYLGQEENLVKISERGTLIWRYQSKQGKYGLSKPEVSDGRVYAGTDRGEIVAIDSVTGNRVWSTNVYSGVTTDIIKIDDGIYLGTIDGKIYKIDPNDGTVIWKTDLGLAAFGEPERGTIGDREAVFFGSGNKGVYVISTESGEEIWKAPSGSIAGSPLVYNGQLIFGSADKGIYAYTTEKSCSIQYPMEGIVIGNKELEIKGKRISQNGEDAYVKINEQEWIKTESTGDQNWTMYQDPKKALNPGLNVIYCKIGEGDDAIGQVGFVYDPNTPNSNILISASTPRIEGTAIKITINDQETGEPLGRFKAILDGKEIAGNTKLNLNLTAGKHSILIKKMGYNDGITNFEVQEKGMSILVIAGIAIVVLVILAIAAKVFLKKKQ